LVPVRLRISSIEVAFGGQKINLRWSLLGHRVGLRMQLRLVLT
jgi:hypothetical protein